MNIKTTTSSRQPATFASTSPSQQDASVRTPSCWQPTANGFTPGSRDVHAMCGVAMAADGSTRHGIDHLLNDTNQEPQMSNYVTLGPHLTFDEQVDAGHDDPRSCSCWYVGNGQIIGLTRDQVQHPDEYRAGAQAALDHDMDL